MDSVPTSNFLAMLISDAHDPCTHDVWLLYSRVLLDLCEWVQVDSPPTHEGVVNLVLFFIDNFSLS